MRCAKLTALIALVAGTVVESAMAQSAAPRTPVASPVIGGSQGGRNVGNDDDDLEGEGVAGLPGYPGRGLAISGRFVTLYDTNLSRQPIKDDGLRMRPTVNGSFGLGSGRVGIYGVGTVGRDFIFGNQRLSGNDRHSYGAGITASLSRCTLDLGASYRRALTFMGDLAVFGALEQATTLMGANVQCRISSALAATASVTQGSTSVVRGLTTAFDSDRSIYNAGVQFSRPGLGVITLSGSSSDVVLTGRQVLTPDGLVDDGLTQRSVRLGYSRAIGSRINISLGASYLDTQPTATSNLILVDGILQVVDRDSVTGPGYDARLDLRPIPRLSLGIGATRGIRANNVVGARITVFNTIEADLSYKIGRSIGLSAFYQKRSNSFRGGVVTALEPIRRDADQFTRYGARVGFDLGRFLNLALNVNHNSRSSDLGIFNFDSTGVGLVLGFKLGKQGGK